MADRKQSQFTSASDFTDSDAVGILKPTGGSPAWDNFLAPATKFWDWIVGKSDPPSALSSAGTLADTDELLIRQSTDEIVRAPLGARLSTWMQSNLLSFRPTPVYLNTNTTLTATAHNNRTIICTAALTLTMPTTAQEGFSCLVKNRSTGVVTLSGHYSPDSHTQIAAGRRATLFGYSISGTLYVEAAGETS
jgi:hypothetical protein